MAETFTLTNPNIIYNNSPKISVAQSPQRTKALPVKEKPQIKTNKSTDERQWLNLLQIIQFTPSDPDCYKEMVIKPGFSFFKALALAQSNPSLYNINIAATFVSLDNSSIFLYTDENGKLQKRIDENYLVFDKQIVQQNQKLAGHIENLLQRYGDNRNFSENTTYADLLKQIDIFKSEDAPYVVEKCQLGQKEWETYKQVLSYKQNKDKRGHYESHKAIQQYIFSKTGKSQTIRYVYFTKNNKEMKGNYAFVLHNKGTIFDHKSKMALTRKGAICAEQKDSFTVSKICSEQVLTKFENMSEQIVQYLEKNYSVRIIKIVLDYCQDFFGQIYLIGCKYIELEQCKTMADYLAQRCDVADCEKALDQLTCSVYCKLCGIIFKKDDASKLLTYKLIHEFAQHLKKRNTYLKDIALKVQHSSTRPCRVCTLCYMLVVSEHELIEIEQKFAMQQAIPIYDPIFRVPNSDQNPKSRPALLSSHLFQWRIIFYYTDVQDVMRNDVDQKQLHLQYKLHNHTTDFPIFETQPKIKRSQSAFRPRSDTATITVKRQQDMLFKPMRDINLNKMRIHYFFSQTEDIEKFLKNTDIVLRLTIGNDWENFIAEGRSKTIERFVNKSKDGQRHSCQILLFFDDAKYCTLHLYTGLVCDGKYDTGQMNLYKYNNIYFPDESYYTGNTFPDVWMELFDGNYIQRKDEIVENADKYSPKCSKLELNQMINYQEQQATNKFKNVQPKVQTRQLRTQSEFWTQEFNQIDEKIYQLTKEQENDIGEIEQIQLKFQKQTFSNILNSEANIQKTTENEIKKTRQIRSQSQNKIKSDTLQLVDSISRNTGSSSQKRMPNSQRPQSSTRQRPQSSTRLDTKETHRILLEKSKNQKQDEEEKEIFRKYDILSDYLSQGDGDHDDLQRPLNNQKSKKQINQKNQQPLTSSEVMLKQFKKLYNLGDEKQQQQKQKKQSGSEIPPRPYRDRAITDLRKTQNEQAVNTKNFFQNNYF